MAGGSDNSVAARQCFAVLARRDGGTWQVRLLLTGCGDDAAATLSMIDLTPERADLLAQELLQSAHLARNPGKVPE